MKQARLIISALILTLCAVANAQDPAPLIPQKTQAQADLERLDQGILNVAQALNHAAAILSREHSAIWSLPDDRLLALLNANVQRTIAIAQAKDKAAVEINSLLNQLNIAAFTNRAPVGFGREDVIFNKDTSQFEIVEAPEE